MIASQKKVLIVGGGLAGLACAIRLHEAGVRPFIFERSDGLGTSAQLRASDNTGVTVSTNPVFQVFGRSKDSANAWQKLLNQNGSADLTCKFTGSGSDPITEDGRIRTTPDADSSFDMAGCDEFFVARKTALAVSDGTVTASGVEAKVL